jgi:hypothetical protein
MCGEREILRYDVPESGHIFLVCIGHEIEAQTFGKWYIFAAQLEP